MKKATSRQPFLPLKQALQFLSISNSGGGADDGSADNGQPLRGGGVRQPGDNAQRGHGDDVPHEHAGSEPPVHGDSGPRVHDGNAPHGRGGDGRAQFGNVKKGDGGGNNGDDDSVAYAPERRTLRIAGWLPVQ